MRSLSSLTLSASLIGVVLAADLPEPSAKTKQLVGGEKVVALIRGIESVDAFRVGSVEDYKKGETADPDKAVAGRTVTGKPVAMSKDFAAKLTAALLADDTYWKSDSKGTGKNTGVAFRGKSKDGGVVEVSFCLEKGNVFLRVLDPSGKVIKYGDCRGFREDKQAPLRALAAEAFPDDPEIQKFKPKPVSEATPVEPVDAKGPFEPGAKPVKVADGFTFTEGPTSDKDGNVYFTDQPSDRILKWSADGKLSTFVEKSGRANGLCFDKDGKLWACSDEKNELRKYDIATKEFTVVVKDYDGKLLNGPNDVWVGPTGVAYFTDPFYKRKWWTRGAEEQEKRRLYIVSANGDVSRADGDYKQPNGVVGSPDGKTLYVADIMGKQTFAYDIKPDGSLANRRKFCDAGSDGMTVDADGNVYLTGETVTVYNLTGKKVGELAVPERPSNVCFGGKDGKTLFVTARTGLYAVPMRVASGGRQ
jgi:gluconolactonase